MKRVTIFLILLFSSSTAVAQSGLKAFAKESGSLYKKATRLASSQKKIRAVPNFRTNQKLFKWVKASLRYEPYVGSLRSAEGVLVSGGGNSIDIALLIAKELESQGKKVRFVTTEWTDREREKVSISFLGAATLLTSEDIEKTVEVRFDNPIPPERTYVEVFEKGKWISFDPIVDNRVGAKKLEPIQVQDKLDKKQLGTIEIEIVAKFTDGQERVLFKNAALLNEVGVSDWQLSFEPSPSMEGNVIPVLLSGLDRQKTDDFPPSQLSRLTLNVNIQQDSFQNRNERILFENKNNVSFEGKNAVYSLHLFGSWVDFDWASTQVAAQLMKVSNALQGWTGDAFAEVPTMKKRRFVQWLNTSRNGLGSAIAFSYIASLDNITRDLARTFGVQPFISEPRIVLVSSVPGKGNLQFRIEPLLGRIDSQSKIGIPKGASQAFHAIFGLLESRIRSSTESLFTKEAHWFDTVKTAKTLKKVSQRTKGLSLGDKRRIRQDAREGNLILSTLPLLDAKGWWALLPEAGTVRSHRLSPHTSLIAKSEVVDSPTLAIQILKAAQVNLAFFQKKKPVLKSTPAVCKSLKRLKNLSGLYCAEEGKHIPAPTLLRCIELKLETDSLMNGDCRERSEYFRCGAVLASGLLGKKMTVMYTGNQSPFDIPKATKIVKKKKRVTGITCR